MVCQAYFGYNRFHKRNSVNVLADPDNVKVFDNYVKIKSGGLNMVIPIVDAAAGKKEWDEAIARGAGDVVQDLAVGSATTALYVWVFGSNPVGWGCSGCWRYNIRYYLG